MRENPMGKLFKEFLVANNFTMFNTWFATGQTFTSQMNNAKTRIDGLIGPMQLILAGRVGQTKAYKSLAACCAWIPSHYLVDHLPIGATTELKLEHIAMVFLLTLIAMR